jgi:hypothetical protein
MQFGLHGPEKYDLGFVLLLAFLGGAIIFVLWPYL